MSICYVNGRYVPHHDATVHIEDRGYQFADGIYEVIAIKHGCLIDGDPHFARLQRSLFSLDIPLPMPIQTMKIVIQELLRQNRKLHVNDDAIYIQISRGVAKRNHLYSPTIKPSLVMTFLDSKGPAEQDRTNGIAILTTDEIRWQRRDIKTIGLLPNIMAKQRAKQHGCKEAWFVTKEGCITEGSSTNAFMVHADGTILTHPATPEILEGITRNVVLELARHHNIPVKERAFTLDEACKASELFLTSTTQAILPVTKINDTIIGNGHPRPITQALMAHYDTRLKNISCIKSA